MDLLGNYKQMGSQSNPDLAQLVQVTCVCIQCRSGCLLRVRGYFFPITPSNVVACRMGIPGSVPANLLVKLPYKASRPGRK